MRKRLFVAFVSALLVGAAVPAAAQPHGYIEDTLAVGYFYSTFGQSPNLVLLVGGTAEDFCEANPDDPFSGEPGAAPLRVFPRQDGTVDLKVNDTDQPINLYESEFEDAPPWIESVCAEIAAGGSAPEPFASGLANLKVRVSVISENLVDVFNSVNGVATGTDGTQYKVRGWADLVVEDGMPVGDPADFVGLVAQEMGH